MKVGEDSWRIGLDFNLRVSFRVVSDSPGQRVVLLELEGEGSSGQGNSIVSYLECCRIVSRLFRRISPDY